MKRFLEKIVDNAVLAVMVGLTGLSLLAWAISTGIEIYQSSIAPTKAVTVGSKLTVLTTIALIGLLAARLRHTWRQLYGLLEIIVGLAMAWNLPSIAASSGTLTNVLALVGVTFLVSQGFHGYMHRDFVRLDETKRELLELDSRRERAQRDLDLRMAESRAERAELKRRMDEMLKETAELAERHAKAQARLRRRRKKRPKPPA